MFTKYHLTLKNASDNSVIDTTTLDYPSNLKRSEVLKRVRQYLSIIGYGGKKFKFSLQKLSENLEV